MLKGRSFSTLSCQEYDQSDLNIDHLVFSMSRVVSCVIGKGCLCWLLCSLDKILLAFALLHFVLQGQTCLILQASLDFLFLHSNPLWWRGHLFLELVLESLGGLHRTIQLQLLQAQCLEIDLDYCDAGLFAWKWIKIILSVLRLHPSTAFELLLTMRPTPFLLRDSFPQ